MHFFCWYGMHSPCNAILVSQENLHVLQQENANGLQLSWNSAPLPFLKGRLQSQQPTLGILLELGISEHNMTSHIPVCARCPPAEQELGTLPKYPSGYNKRCFSGSTLSVREKQFRARWRDESLKQYGLPSSSSTEHWVVGTTTSKTSVPQFPTPPWPHQAGRTLPGLTQTSDESCVPQPHCSPVKNIWEIRSYFRWKKN